MRTSLYSLVLSLALLIPASAQQDGNILLQDDFSTRANRWTLPASAKFQATYQDEQFMMASYSPNTLLWSVPDTDLVLTRYRLTLTATIQKTTGEGNTAGVVFNYQDDENFYWWEVEPTGLARLQVIKNGKTPHQPLAEGYVTPSRVYKLDLLVIEGEFSLTLNDETLPIVKNTALTDGIIGLYARSGQGAIQASFDNLRVVDIPK